MEIKSDICGVGNAIVDVIAPASDDFLAQHNITRGAMTLIFDENSVEKLYNSMAQAKTVSGGSGANSLAGIASLGGKAAYFGKVANDELGALFNKEMNEIGVVFDTLPYIDGPATARCMINVTPDGQRSMRTYLGCSPFMDENDLEEEKIGASKIIFLEGIYLTAMKQKLRLFALLKLQKNIIAKLHLHFLIYFA